jgi:yecA family protein
MAGLPDYHELEQGMGATGSPGEVAEAHGTLCGLLCGSSDDLPGAWIENTLADRQEDPDSAPLDASVLLVQLYEATRGALQGDAMEFGLMLPADTEELEARLQALAAWCQGFLYGLAMRGLRSLQDIEGEIREFLEDLVEISRVEPDEDGDGEAAEVAYSELVEYVRVGAQILFDETRSAARPVQKSVS